MKKILALAVGLFAAFAASAQTYTATWPARPQYGSVSAVGALAACQAGYGNVVPKYQAENSPAIYNYSNVVYAGSTNGGTCTADIQSQEYPGGAVANSTVSWVQLTVGSQSNCAANAGKIKTVNRTEGWYRSPLASDTKALPGGPAPGPTVMTDGECKVVVVESGQCFRSQVPTAQGLYRSSCDYRVIQTDQPLAPVPGEPTSAGAPDATCPGAIGEVNGVLGCYGTASGPVSTVPRPPPTPETPGNPSAGEQPSTGPGAGSGGEGRTPMTGTGGNAGGPSTAARDVRGTGRVPTATDGTEQAECGAPGQPKCLIDESGTPNDIEAMEFKAHADKYKTEQDAARGTISGTGDKNFFGGWGNVFFLPPIATCSPIEMPFDRGTIDPCPVVDGTRSIMAWLWALAGLYLCVQMIRKVV